MSARQKDTSSLDEHLYEGPSSAATCPTVHNESMGSKLQSFFSRKFSSVSVGDSNKKVCLICLENLEEEDFKNGTAISLQCECKGDNTFRHKACAIKWAQVKGSILCDLCKTPIRNLPDIEALPPPELVEPTSPEEAYYYAEDTVPPALDLSFDFLRITWISTIICVLFVQLDLQESLWIGSLVGALYVLMIKLITYCSNCNANAS
mmetsp:Transcript_5452/g.9883  ORF Transcript_5452/g.9883 Transcript_5452/m.9883 type:complete len:206 (+) Transcript_5452:133-750(+)